MTGGGSMLVQGEAGGFTNTHLARSEMRGEPGAESARNIESATDDGSGALEFAIALGLLAVSIVSGLLAAREWRRAQPT